MRDGTSGERFVGRSDLEILNARAFGRTFTNGLAPKVAIASPYDIWCAGMEALVRERGAVLGGRWRSGEEALTQAGCAEADVLILAHCLVERPAGAVAFRPHAASYFGKIVVVVEPTDAFTAEDFVALDVDGLMLSVARLDEVDACFDSVCQGRRWIDPGIRALLGQSRRPAPDASGLSSRELEVARMAAAGLSNKRIARALNLSEGTVKMHMHHILAKLRLNSRFDLMRQAVDFGAEPPDPKAARGQEVNWA